MPKMSNEVKIKNRKARFEYEILKDYTAGIQLAGTEVKSIRAGQVSLNDAYCYFRNGELWVKNMSVQPMEHMPPHDPGREKKLLLNRDELDQIQGKMEKGMTLVVTEVFTNSKGLIKVQVALAKGKKLYDKRQSIKERDIDRDTKRDIARK